MSHKLLVAALGNWNRPLTRHSYAQVLLENLSARFASQTTRTSRHLQLDSALQGWLASYTLELGHFECQLFLYKPKALMNINGRPIRKAADTLLAPSLSAKPIPLIVIHDEMELAPGKMRIRPGGKDKGHNGLKSVTGAMKTSDYYRIGLGIGRPESRDPYQVAEYVLSPLSRSELDLVSCDYGQPRLLDEAEKAIIDIANKIKPV